MRTEDDAAPALQCPACGVAYATVGPRRGRGDLLRPRRRQDPVPRADLDASVWGLVGANLLTLAVAFWQAWDVHSLMLLFWAQSVIIGVSNVFRILSLEAFSTSGFTMNDRPVPPTPESKRKVAGFFAVHYGGFHAFYLLFLVLDGGDAVVFDGWFAACVVLFAVNHYWSFRYNVEIDRRGDPNIGTLMATPYLRVVPMHLTILLGGLLGKSTFGLLLFVALKTGADVGMHLVEHHQLRKQRRRLP